MFHLPRHHKVSVVVVVKLCLGEDSTWDVVTTLSRERDSFLEQSQLQLDPVSRLHAPQGPSGPATFEGGSNSERLTACLVGQLSSLSGLDTGQALRDVGDASTVPISRLDFKTGGTCLLSPVA
jgi:hypothetical protein